ncbi:hypothetical protein E5358_13815 [Palleniella muris]|uniref:Uncharacterized protein n=1 Tax=Palleniella muris TaxID=3038145 RepID=A0AC61QLT1_9BACT|nr:hypothetical protein [Palleniella muris]TGX80017.1 hypothetical protein E5358_13815 [Palleniella muris]
MKTSRLLQLVRWNIMTRKGKIVRGFFGGVIGTLFAAVCANGLLFGKHFAGHGTYESMAAMLLVVLAVIMLKYATQISFNNSTKTGFISYAMIPATNLEKFLASWIYVTFVLGALLIASFVVGDFAQMAVTMVRYGKASSLTWAVLHTLYNMLHVESAESLLGIALGVYSAISIHGKFIFGGTLFRKHQFIYTCILLVIVIPFVLSLLLGGLVYLGKTWLDSTDTVIIIEWYVGETFVKWAVLAIGTVVVSLFYWLSYRLFCRSQIINNRMFNI